MLNKKNKLPIKGRLNTLTTIVSPLFIVKIAKNQEEKNRFAIIVSKEVDKRAVYRNKLKRSISEGIKGVMEELKQGHDFLIISKKAALAKNAYDIEQELRKLFKKESLLK